EHHGHRLAAAELQERRPDDAVERSPVALADAARAEPRHLHRSVADRDPLGRPGEGAVAHDEAAGEDGSEDGGAGEDADRDEREPLLAVREPRPDQPERVRQTPDEVHPTSSRPCRAASVPWKIRRGAGSIVSPVKTI